MISVHVLVFGILKERFATNLFSVELPENSTVGNLLAELNTRLPSPIPQGIAIGVNAEFASADHTLRHNDEVALLPPVSGGAPDTHQEQEPVFVALTWDPIDIAELRTRTHAEDDGAIVLFDGVVRNQTRGRKVLHLDYETYMPMAQRQLHHLATEARVRFNVRSISVVHRLGRMQVSESSIVIVTSSPHRAAAFEACRWLIDTIKQQVPIWKRETFVDGICWADGDPFPENIPVVRI